MKLNPKTTQGKERWDSDLWFSLSYASWLVLPRVALQSMSEDWQDKFFTLVEELFDRVKFPVGYEELDFSVTAKRGSKFVRHDLPGYRHNNLPLKNA